MLIYVHQAYLSLYSENFARLSTQPQLVRYFLAFLFLAVDFSFKIYRQFFSVWSVTDTNRSEAFDTEAKKGQEICKLQGHKL